ncbi:MAG TPA: hypothetical protein VGS19_14850 [Streptosporangiaceae bacterium]|nr:hypothetical protein [Streptosporangiaceae bacterium]
MTQQYLIGELSVRLERLQAAASATAGQGVAQLRDEVEARPLTWLASATVRALALADALCWECVDQGDAAAFARVASAAAELHQFAVDARLLAE